MKLVIHMEERAGATRQSGPLTRTRLANTAIGVVAATFASTLMATGARWFWLCDLFVHFCPQYALASLVCAVTLAMQRRAVWATLALLTAGMNLASATAQLLPAAHATAAPVVRTEETGAAAPRRRVRIAAANVLYSNTQYDRMAAWLRQADPDAAVLVEVTPAWRNALATLRDRYPYQYYASRSLQRGAVTLERGVLLLSRWPITERSALDMGPHSDPTVRATLALPGGGVLRLYGIHASWPLGARVSAERNRQLRRMVDWAGTARAPLVFAGDFNVTPFSPHFQDLLREARLTDAASGAGWLPTWPTFLPPAGIQIDHVLLSRGIAVLHLERGPAVGSDHWPILAELEWSAMIEP